MNQMDIVDPLAKVDARIAGDANLNSRIEDACQQACAAIAPAWPLDRSIAVNPHWGRIGMPLRTVAARLAVLGDVHVYPSRSDFLQAWSERRITTEDLHDALAQLDIPGTAGFDHAYCLNALTEVHGVQTLPLLIDLLDDGPGRAHRLPWRQAVTHQVSQTCAAYFDQYQADWQPQRQQGLYAFWRDTLQHDHGIGILMGLPNLDRQLKHLPATPELAEHWVLNKLGLPPEVWSDYLEALLLTINGWASWCAYLQWIANQEGRHVSHLRELLAIRLAWGAILLDGDHAPNTGKALSELQKSWSIASQVFVLAEESFRVEEVWQLALEAGYQRHLARQLCNNNISVGEIAAPQVQAAFCIDVRSEPLRRALESVDSEIQTIGFAGFFGLPIAYTPMATSARRPQLPGLLAPALEVGDTLVASPKFEGLLPELRKVQAARQQHFSIVDQWQAGTRWPAAGFSYVEAFGWAYASRFGKWLRPKPEARSRDDLLGLPSRISQFCRPSLCDIDIATRVELAARILNAMGLQDRFAPLVVLVGHGSQSRNNPHASALDCGACCGQSGEVNVRVLMDMLNTSEVRRGLLGKEIRIPENTLFVAALHNTTTDELEWFDQDLLPDFAKPRLKKLTRDFDAALDMVRRERVPKIGVSPQLQSKDLLMLLQRRASDGARLRPEWGLAGNAAFIIAPRRLTRGLNLAGRSFLHDYDQTQDIDGSLLELLMTAPMLVTHWINWQYHASRCEPGYYGSGNKVLHNIVGGHIGVFEGNGGDLRIGLSSQSLHDGRGWIHEPLRLTVVIAAPKELIEAVISKHAIVWHLLENGWLHLWQFEESAIWRYHSSQWQLLPVDVS